MTKEILNRELSPGNACFGCGHENPHGLQIEVTRDPASPDRLEGRFTPTEHASGFPGVTHGGALFPAMDCLATWVVVLLGPTDERYWVLGNADVSYRRPGRRCSSEPRARRSSELPGSPQRFGRHHPWRAALQIDLNTPSWGVPIDALERSR